MTEPLAAFAVGALKTPRRLAWADGLTARLPPELAATLDRLRDGDGALTADPAELTGQAYDPARLAAVADDLRARAAYTQVKPTSSRLPISYRHIPTPLRMAAARLIGRWRRRQVDRWAAFPGWPLDLSSDFVADLAGAPTLSLAGPTPVLLTHDLDSPAGLRNLADRFLSAEEAVGARSTNFVVPKAWPLDHGLLETVGARGHEIGVHGCDHANRTPFADADERRARLDAAAPLIERYGASGYRAPSLLRTPALLADVARRYRWDSSIPTAGGLFPVPNNGCASARPYRLGPSLWEIPISLPRDGSLLFLGYKPEEILALWRDCARTVAASGGVVCLLTHCEDEFSGAPRMFDAYRRFLDMLAADDGFAFTTASALVDALEKQEGGAA